MMEIQAIKRQKKDAIGIWVIRNCIIVIVSCTHMQ